MGGDFSTVLPATDRAPYIIQIARTHAHIVLTTICMFMRRGGGGGGGDGNNNYYRVINYYTNTIDRVKYTCMHETTMTTQDL